MIMTREIQTESKGGRLVAADGRELPLASVHLAAQAGGGIARVILTQRFENPFDEPLAVTYLLPLPSDGAVSGFSFTLGDERVIGEVTGRAAARERFERAIVEGRTAALLEQDRSSLFTQQVGNVPPRTTVVAEITVDQPLKWLEDGAWEWRFPTVVGPRYQGEPGRVADAAKIDVPVADGALAVRATLALEVADQLTGAVESPSHALSRDGALLGFGEGAARLDRDVVVRWPVALPSVSANVIAARPLAAAHDGDAFALITVAPPNEGGVAIARDLTFLIDTSGSMSGRPLEQAARIASAMIATLGPDDRIEMIEFSSRPRRWQENPVIATESNKEAARAWLEALRAGGSTEMHRAVLEALRPLRPGSQRQVVLITDGYIGFEREIVATLQEKLPAGARLHTIGVGSAVNRSLTQAAARAGKGVELIVGLEEDPDRVTPRLLARTTAPLVTDLVIEGAAIIETAPRKLPDLFVESPALIAIRTKATGGEVVLRGVTAEGRFERRLTIPALRAGEGPRAVAALFAREKVEDLETALAAGANQAETDRTIEATGVEFQIATRLTSWVAVSRSITVAPGTPLKTVEQPHELPHGVSAAGLGLRPASAAPGGAAGGAVTRSKRFVTSAPEAEAGETEAFEVMKDLRLSAAPPPAPRQAPAPMGPASPLRKQEQRSEKLTRSGAAFGSVDDKSAAEKPVSKREATGRFARPSSTATKERASLWRVFLVLLVLGLVALAIAWLRGLLG